MSAVAITDSRPSTDGQAEPERRSFSDAALRALQAVRSHVASSDRGSDPDRTSVLTVLRAAAVLYGQVAQESDEALTGNAIAHLVEGLPCEPAHAAAALAGMFEASADLSGRQTLGAVYTPPDVVRFMTRDALGSYLATALGLERQRMARLMAGEMSGIGRRELETLRDLLLRLRILDPAVGAGAFLIGAATEVSALADTLAIAGLDGLEGMRTAAGTLRRACRGFELDGDAARAAEYVLAVATAGDHEGRLPEVVGVRNALLDGFEDGGTPWDIVLMNPPYIGEKFLRHRLGRSLQDQLRKQDGFAGDLLVHFVFRGLNALARGGVLSAIVSDTAFTMGTAARMRRLVLEEAQPLTIAWCRPFRSAAVRGGIVTVQRTDAVTDGLVACFMAPGSTSVEKAERTDAAAASFRHIPGRPIYRPTDASLLLAERWSRVDGVEELWGAVLKRGVSKALAQAADEITPGCWTLLGVLARAGQGIATGDDRRFIGFVSGAPEAELALERQRRILATLRDDPRRASQHQRLKRVMAAGASLEDALLDLLEQRDNDDGEDLPERKPFRLVDAREVRSGPLTSDETQDGIASGPTWVRYATGNRASSDGGSTWISSCAAVIDWSVDSVAQLRERRDTGYRRPVLRNPDLWFRPAVTHNRISSYLRARLLPANCLFSSESPVYVPRGDRIDLYALLALMNSPVVEFIVKTFLASRNHIEVGHVLRVPVPVLDAGAEAELSSLGRSAAEAAAIGTMNGAGSIGQRLDAMTRELYLIPQSADLSIPR
jgi:hypothetical protein